MPVWTNGLANGDLNATGNWSDADIPGAGQDAIFNATALGDVTTNMTALQALLLGKIVIQQGYSANIGSSGSPFRVSAAKVVHQGSGHLFYENGTISDTAEIVVDTPSGRATISANTSKNNRLVVLRGNVFLTTGLTGGLDDLFVAGGNVDLQGGANTIVNAYVSGGTVKSKNPVTNLHMSGGSWTQTYDAAGAIANIYLSGSAICVHNDDGTITLAVVQPGATLDMDQDYRPKTITTARVFPGGHLKRNDLLTITNGGTLRDIQDIM